MLFAVVNGGGKTYEDINNFNNTIWSPEKEYSFVTDFSIRGKTYAARKSYARELAMNISDAVSKVSLTWSEIADISQNLERIGKRYGLIKEFKENGLI